MKYKLLQTSRYKKELKRAIRRGCDIRLIKSIVAKLANDEPLEAKHRDHALSGEFAGFRECHIAPDWLLIYLIEENRLTLTLTRTGSHSDLF